MKSIIALILCMFTSMAFANDPNFCKGKNNCIIGKIPLLKSGTYHARGFGKTCQEAMDNSQIAFERIYGDMSCGLISGPYVWSCTKLNNKRFSAWTKCNPDSGPSRQAPRQRCVLIRGAIVC